MPSTPSLPCAKHTTASHFATSKQIVHTLHQRWQRETKRQFWQTDDDDCLKCAFECVLHQMAPHCFPITFVQWYVTRWRSMTDDSYLNNVFSCQNCHISYSLIAFSPTVCSNEFNTVAQTLIRVSSPWKCFLSHSTCKNMIHGVPNTQKWMLESRTLL